MTNKGNQHNTRWQDKIEIFFNICYITVKMHIQYTIMYRDLFDCTKHRWIENLKSPNKSCDHGHLWKLTSSFFLSRNYSRVALNKRLGISPLWYITAKLEATVIKMHSFVFIWYHSHVIVSWPCGAIALVCVCGLSYIDYLAERME